MFYKLSEKYIESCYQELIQAPDPEIQQALQEIKNHFPNGYEETIKFILKDTLPEALKQEMSEEEFDEDFILNLKNFSYYINDAKKSIVLEITLKGLEDKVSRVLEIPYVLSLADLGYAVLACMGATGSHLFDIEYQNIKFYCDYCPDGEDMLASGMFLSQMDLKQGSTMFMRYDYGDDYQFNIKIKEMKNDNDHFRVMDMRVVDGKGCGIWEDEHEGLYLYYKHPRKFKTFLKENGLDIDMFPCDDIDLDVINELLFDEFIMIKSNYEGK